MQESFSKVKALLQDVDQHASASVCKLLLGNKSDLVNKKVVDFVTAKVRLKLHYHRQ